MEKSIPQTDSIQELAHFWDTHDLTDFEDQLEEVHEPVFGRRIVQVELKPREIEALRRLARSQGISHESLIREWVLARIHTQ